MSSAREVHARLRYLQNSSSLPSKPSEWPFQFVLQQPKQTNTVKNGPHSFTSEKFVSSTLKSTDDLTEVF